MEPRGGAHSCLSAQSLGGDLVLHCPLGHAGKKMPHKVASAGGAVHTLGHLPACTPVGITAIHLLTCEPGRRRPGLAHPSENPHSERRLGSPSSNPSSPTS